MKNLLLVILLTLITGCATQILEDGLPHFMGKHINEAFEVLGYPNSKLELAEKTVYEWTNHETGTWTMPTTNTSYIDGTVNGEYFSGTATTYGSKQVPINYYCRIRLTANREGIITYWSFKGNPGGCYYFAKNVKKIIPKKTSKQNASR